MAEFTGERLIPGEVDVDLLNEHMARYHFAVRLARGKRVLDAGCGAGYGSAELANVAESVTAIDIAADAVEYARAHYTLPNLVFEQGSCTLLPYADSTFDLVVAFEVIEHLEDWREFLQQVRRVLTPAGQLIVSTPNRLYYTESRGTHGANPFHVHEFDFDEFTRELKQFFPYVSMFLENHVEGVTFQPHESGNTVETRVDAAEPVPDESHFFIAVCAHRPQIGNPTFLYVPRVANVLRERERHIVKLEGELATKDQWLDKAQADLAEFDREHQKLLLMFREQKVELERSNRWAEELNTDLAARGARIDELQEELARDQENARRVVAGYNAKVAALEQENREKTQWALDTEARLTDEIRKIADALNATTAELEQTEKDLQERTAWALRLDEEKRQLEELLGMVRASRWVKLGRETEASAPRSDMAFLKRLIRALPLLLLSPFLMAISFVALWLVQLFTRRPATLTPSRKPGNTAATVVIPNWNGKDLLEKYIPSIRTALAGNTANQILVVDNGSTDGSADFLRASFSDVTVLALPENLGFGGGSNAGFRAARNEIVVLLNSDMRVAPDFLAPLLEGFSDPEVFAVSCQIFFTDPNKLREETGLTQGWWQDGSLRVRHRIDDAVGDLFPCFYGGGGSCAFDRAKFLELGGFDSLLEPFYLEDTDLGYMAWKRGWKVLYQPRSVVFHEHRGTIGKKFTQDQIQAVLKKNYVLFCWKNIHEWPRLVSHFFFAWAGAVLAVMFGDIPLRPNLGALWRAFQQLPQALRSRRRALALGQVTDSEAFKRPLGGYFRDRFEATEPAPDRLRVLFVSPYPICPPIHGGGVFMYQTLREMVKLAEVHVVELLDWPSQEADNQELRTFCASAEWLVRPSGRPKGMGSLEPHAVREFANGDLEWLIHRQLYCRQIDVLQLEYTPMAQYRGEFRRIGTALFEHDVYFQSIGRGLGHMIGVFSEMKARIEYLRALRYELGVLPSFDQVQVCTPANREYLLSFRPELAARMRAGLRAGIDTGRYEFRPRGREPLTMLFLGSWRHDPNRVAVDWFIRHVLPLVLAQEPGAQLVIAGSDPPPEHTYADHAANMQMLGYVEDVRDALARYAIFVCPILSGSGVRVKLLEAFAGGIPVVSTFVGAEGLAAKDGEFCALADDPAEFAGRVIALLRDPERAAAMAERARAEVVAQWDMAAITRRLVDSYRDLVKEKRR